jgi:hypothetical protein
MKIFDPFENDRTRCEWIAQERACRDNLERTSSLDDSRVKKYRLIDLLLRNPPIDPIPPDFAFRTAARAELAAEASDETLEAWLERGLLAALAIVGCLTMLTFGGNWAGSLDALRSSGSLVLEPYKTWGALAVSCVIASTLFQQGPRFFRHRRN